MNIDGVESGGGDVVGPISATDNAVVRYNLTSGKVIQSSGVTISDSNVMSGLLDPVDPQDAATKAYVDGYDDLAKLNLTGGTMSGAIAMGTQKITGLGDPTNLQDAATKAYVDGYDDLAKLNLTGGTMSGAIAMGTQKITGLGDPTNLQDAATKAYVDGYDDLAKLNLTGGTMSGAIAMGTQKITGLGDPTNLQDAATKAYVDDQNPFDTTIANVEPLNELVSTYGSPSVCIGVRKLVSTYTGSCFNVTDALSATVDIGFDANGIADYTAFSALTAPVYINTWYDQSGNNHDFTGAIATIAKPALTFTTVNGRNNPSVVFNGSKFSYTNQLDLGLQNASHTSIFSMKSNSGAIQFLSGSGVDAQKNEILLNNSVGLTVFDDSYAPPTQVANIGSAGDYTNNSWHTLVGGSNGNFATCRADLLTDSVASGSAIQNTTALVHYLGIRNFTSVYPLDGEMSEFVVFPNDWITNDTMYVNYHTNNTEFHTLGYNNAISAEFKPIKNIMNPQDPQDAATKAYTDTKLALTGGTMTGLLTGTTISATSVLGTTYGLLGAPTSDVSLSGSDIVYKRLGVEHMRFEIDKISTPHAIKSDAWICAKNAYLLCDQTSDGAVELWDVVSVSTTTDERFIKCLSASPSSAIGVSFNVTTGAGQVISVVTGGITTVNSSGVIARGDLLACSVANGRVSTTVGTDAFMVAMSVSAGGNAQIRAMFL
jgi:hypothetical protein